MAVEAKITITVTEIVPGQGLLASLSTSGDYSSEAVDLRFYSVGEGPPAAISPEYFWGTVLGAIGPFLVRGDS